MLSPKSNGHGQQHVAKDDSTSSVQLPGDELTSLSPSFEVVGACLSLPTSQVVLGQYHGVSGPVSSFTSKASRLTLVTEQEESVHSAPAEPSTKHRELPWRKAGYFIMHGAAQENGKLLLKKLELPHLGSGQVFKGLWGQGCQSAGGRV